MTLLKRLAHQIGRRGIMLLFFACVDLVFALTFAFPTQATLASPVFRFFGGLFDFFLTLEQGLLVWAVVWGGVGITCLVFAFRKHNEVAFIAATLLKFFWTATILGAWLFLNLERGYLSAVTWGFFTVVAAIHINWRENWERAV